jgi:hypothetical protein
VTVFFHNTALATQGQLKRTLSFKIRPGNSPVAGSKSDPVFLVSGKIVASQQDILSLENITSK